MNYVMIYDMYGDLPLYTSILTNSVDSIVSAEGVLVLTVGVFWRISSWIVFC